MRRLHLYLAGLLVLAVGLTATGLVIWFSKQPFLANIKNQFGQQPIINITSPVKEAVVSGNVSITATVSSDFSVTKVEFYVDKTLLPTEPNSRYKARWDTKKTPNDKVVIVVRAYDAKGNKIESTINVRVDNKADTISATRPPAGTPAAPNGASSPSAPSSPPAAPPPAPPPPAAPPPGSSQAFCNSYPALPSTRPTAANTGVPSGTSLTTVGSINANVDGMVIDAQNVTDGIVVNANNVTIKNSKITTSGYYGVYITSGFTGTQILNSEIYTLNGGYIGINGGNAFVCGNYIHGYENGMTIGSGMMVQANYIDKLASNQPNPHFDGIEVYYDNNIRLWGNNIRLTDVSGAWMTETGAINITAYSGNIDNVELNGNWIGGGSYTLYVDEQAGYKATNVRITNNRWYRNSYLYGPATVRTTVTWSNNLFDDNGQPVTY